MTQTVEVDVALRGAIEKVASGTISLSDLLKAVAPEPIRVPAPTTVPLPAKISQEQSEALEKVVEIFGKITPQERRTLEPAEIEGLLEERGVLDQIKKMAQSRQDDIRTTVFNHLDVLVEQEGLDEDAERDKDGHYAVAGEVAIGDVTTKFVRQISQRSPSITEGSLKALVDDPDADFTHEDYLSMTSPVRVIDENKVMLVLKKRPDLLPAIAKATQPGGKTASLYQRKR